MIAPFSPSPPPIVALSCVTDWQKCTPQSSNGLDQTIISWGPGKSSMLGHILVQDIRFNLDISHSPWWQYYIWQWEELWPTNYYCLNTLLSYKEAGEEFIIKKHVRKIQKIRAECRNSFFVCYKLTRQQYDTSIATLWPISILCTICTPAIIQRIQLPKA